MSTALLLLPDFSLILLGLFLKRRFEPNEAFWTGAERLIYVVLFPALLFSANARAHLGFAAAMPMLAAGIGATFAGIALGWLARPLFRPDVATFAGGYQCAFRFNTYIGLAIISRMHGEAGLAPMSLLLGIAIPLVNVVAVSSLARGAASIPRELARNPLILATVGGIAFGAAGLDLPEPVWLVLGRLGAASLPLGLLAVGAALNLQGTGRHGALIAWWLAVKLLAVPACALLIAWSLKLDAISLHCAMVFAALPPATSAYILAVRMGGNAKIASALISSGTLAAMLTLPAWVAMINGAR